MKVLLLLPFFFLFVQCDYPRMKYRPAPYAKPPPYQPMSKKWQHGPRPPLRGRPIPVHMPPHHKIQMNAAASVNRPVALPPVRNFWKNGQTTMRTPIQHNIQTHRMPIEPHYPTSAPVLPKKIFQSSPAILAQEYDFHIQSNNIPTPIKTIKQIGEKGPIHTIPAPKLSPADKPQNIEEVKPKQKQPDEQLETFVQIQKSHQYQVTEGPELKQTLKILDSPYPDPNELYHILNSYPANDEKKEVTASYNLEPEPSESIAQSQFVQNYFDQSERDTKPENGTLDYYVSLPNKEAAESLATLQAAGQLNSNLSEMIYVPDEEEKDEEYDLMTEEFGHRIQPKN